MFLNEMVYCYLGHFIANLYCIVHYSISFVPFRISLMYISFGIVSADSSLALSQPAITAGLVRTGHVYLFKMEAIFVPGIGLFNDQMQLIK